MEKRINFRDLKFRFWLYLGGFAVAIMIILWLFQIIFFNSFYEGMKQREIKRIGEKLEKSYGTEHFEENLYRVSFRNGLIVQLFDENRTLIISSNMFGNFRPFKNGGKEVEHFFNMFSDGKDKVLEVINDDRLRAKLVVYGSKLVSKDGKKVYLYINAPLERLDATSAVLQDQLIIITVLSLVIAIMLGYFIAKKFAKPITKMNETSKKLAKGDYNVVFEGGEYTEIDELADTLNYTTKELKKTDELRKDLIANVSHDLRTPLTIIKAYAEMIRDLSGENKEKREEHSQIIIDETDRLSNLVGELLDLSKLESRNIEIQQQNFELTELIKTTLKRFKILEEQEGYNFVCDELGNQINVYADSDKIEQVLYNLLNNAVKHTGEDKKITIKIEEKEELIKVSIIDTGKGIEAEELDKVWDRYYRSSKERTRKNEGTGIGLSIVKNILELHQVDFGINSTLGVGTEFWFELKKNI